MTVSEGDAVLRIVETTIVAAGAAALYLAVRKIVASRARRGRFPRLAVRPVDLALKYTIVLVALLLVLGCWGFPVDSVIGSLGAVLGLLGIGFVAMWSVLSNVVCTFVLVGFKPFSAGDEIEFVGNNLKGRVTDLNLVFTTLAVDQNETILVPNNVFFQQVFKRRIGINTVDLEQQLTDEEPHLAGPLRRAK
jgi:small-conductance mechanosensitive channel